MCLKRSRALPILSLPPPDLQAWTQKGLQTAHEEASEALFHSNKCSRKTSFALLTPQNINNKAAIICTVVGVGSIYNMGQHYILWLVDHLKESCCL